MKYWIFNIICYLVENVYNIEIWLNKYIYIEKLTLRLISVEWKKKMHNNKM